jgi:hypothetical protein
VGIVAAAAGLALGAVAPAHAQQLLVNGGFEDPQCGFAPDGWVETGNTGFMFVDCDPTHAAQGTQSFAAGPVGSLGFLSQSFNTQVGQPLHISFEVNLDGLTPSEFSVELDPGTASARALLDIINPASSGGYEAFQFDNHAQLTTTTLSFNFQDDNGQINLDAVSVAPEPASMALVGAGLAGLWAGRRRKKLQ